MSKVTDIIADVHHLFGHEVGVSDWILIDQKKKCIYDDMIESLITTAFEGEKSEDGVFSDREMKRLVTRMKNLPALTIKEDLLNEALNKDRNVLKLIEIIRHLDIEGVQLGDRIFIVDENDPRLIEQLQNK